jgi:hypothetical protein
VPAAPRLGALSRHQGNLNAPAERPFPVWPIAVAATACGAAAFALYLRTLAPTLPTGDSGELITVAWLLGIAHPSGYPLFTMLGHAFALLPFGTPALRVNLMSAVLDAITVALVVLTAYQLLTHQSHDEGGRGTRPKIAAWLPPIAGAMFAGLILAFSTNFWAYSVVAEVFALNNLFAILILLLLLAWARRPERLRLLWLAGFVSGLALTNHQTIALLAPACLALLVSGSRALLTGRASVRVGRGTLLLNFGIAGAFLSVGLLPYLYLPLAARRDPALNWGDPRSLQGFIRDVTRADYGSLRLTVANGGLATPPGEHVFLLMRSLWSGFTPLGCVLALLGLWWLWRRQRAAATALLLAFMFTGLLFLAYADPPIDSRILYGVLERFYILPGIFLAIAAGVGAAQMVEIVEHLPIERAPRLAPLGAVALLLIPLISARVHYDAADRSSNRVAHNFGTDLLSPLDQGALLIVQGDAPTMAIDYLQQVEGYRRDVVALNVEKLKMPAYVRQMERQHPQVVIPFPSYRPGSDQMARMVDANLASRPVYVLWNSQDSNFGDRFDSEYAGFTTRLLTKGTGAGPFALMADRLDFFERARYPTKHYPDTTFESAIVKSYGSMAFDVGFTLDDGMHVQKAIDYYRLAIGLSTPEASTYKNLGLILYNQGRPYREVASVWEEYLRLKPDDPQSSAIRERLRQLRGSG